MRNLLLLGLFGLSAAVAGCTTVPDDAAKLGVNFHFTETNRCSTVSPAITVTGAPASTVKFSVRMHDHQAPSFNHGGGTVPATGAAIPAGALENFRGPCPPSGKHDYEITVQAIDAGGKIVGVGSADQMF